MERNTKTLTLGDDPKISEMPKSEDEQRRQNEDYARNLGLDVIDPIGDNRYQPFRLPILPEGGQSTPPVGLWKN